MSLHTLTDQPLPLPQDTLRGLGVDDEMLRLPLVVHDNPAQRQGLDLLMDCYIHR